MRRAIYERAPYFAAVGALLGILLFGFAIAYVFARQQWVDRRLCAQTVENRAAIRATWSSARVLVLRSQTDPQLVERTNQFFDSVLRPIPPLECRDNRPLPRLEG